MNFYCQTFGLDGPRRGTPLVFLLLVFGSLSESLAYTGFSVSLPQLPNNRTGYSTQSGLQVKFQSSWVGNRGYWPVEVQVTSPTASTADRQITIRFSAGAAYTKSQPITVEQDLELKQGDATASTKLLVPQYIDWNVCTFEVWVDGALDKQLSQPWVQFVRSNSNASFTMLILRDPASKWLGRAIQTDYGGIDFLVQSPQLEDNWLDYSAVDVVVVALGDLKQWKGKFPVRHEALLRWVRAGGNLWVAGAGIDLARLPEIDRALGAPNVPHASEDFPPDVPAPGWHYLPFQGGRSVGVDALLNLRSSSLQWADDQPGTQPLNQDNPNLAIDSRHWFATRSFGMGLVNAFRRPDDITSESSIEAVNRSLLANRIDWSRRHGNDPSRGNDEFNNFLIPDVGVAPVFEFQVLISLFVIGIGPVNYWLLSRRGQLPLLLLIVPTAALATVLVLFAYGFLSEGAGTRIRARSFTMLDQNTGEAACWARLSYFAGIAPDEGLCMPADVTVYPILPSSNANYRTSRRYANQPRELIWDYDTADQPQHLTRGWLAARTPTQYQTITSRVTEKHIGFTEPDDGLVATNHLGVDVTLLAVQDETGEFYLVEKLAAGESSPLQPIGQAQAMAAVRTLLASFDPQFPIGGEVGSSRYNKNLLSRNVMETELAAITSPTVQQWGNRTYIAITTQGIELDLGLEVVTEEDSCHVVRGSW